MQLCKKTLQKANRRPTKGYISDLGAQAEVVHYEPERARQSVGDTITDPIERMLIANKNIKIVSGKGGQLIDGKLARASYMRRMLGSRWQARSRGKSRDGNRISGAHRITVSSLGRIGQASRDNPDIISPETARLRGTILGVPGDIVQRGSYLAQTLELEPEQLSLTEAAQDWRDLPEMQAREQQVCATFLSVLDGFKGLVSDLSLWEGYNVDLENQQVLHVCAEVNRLLEKLRDIVAQLVPETAKRLLDGEELPNQVMSVEDMEQLCKAGRPSLVSAFISREIQRARLATMKICPPAMLVRRFTFMRRADWPLLCSLQHDLDRVRQGVRHFYREVIGVSRGRWRKINTLIMPVIARNKIREKAPTKVLAKDSKVATTLKQSLQGTAVSNYRGKFAQTVAEGHVAQTDWTGMTQEKSKNLRGHGKRDKESPLAGNSPAPTGKGASAGRVQAKASSEMGGTLSSISDELPGDDAALSTMVGVLGMSDSVEGEGGEQGHVQGHVPGQAAKYRVVKVFKGRKSQEQVQGGMNAEVLLSSYKPCKAVTEVERLSKEAKERRLQMELQDRFCSDRFYHDRMPLVELPEELDLGRGQATRENLTSFFADRISTPLPSSLFERRQRERIREVQRERKEARARRGSDARMNIWYSLRRPMV